MDEQLATKRVDALSRVDLVATVNPTAQSPSPATVAAAPSPTVAHSVQLVRWLGSDMARLAADIQPMTAGVPRGSLTVPVCPVAEPTDTVLYELATDPAKRYYLPRYRIAQTAPPTAQYRMAMGEDSTGWSLTVHLEAYPAPEIGDAAATAATLDHSVDVILRYGARVGGNEAATTARQIKVFQERNVEEGGIVAVLRGTELLDRDQVFGAMTDSAAGAELVVRRTVQVAVVSSTAPQQTVVSSGQAVLRGTWMFDFDAGAESTSGDVWWEQQTATERQLVPQGQAALVNLGAVDFDALGLTQLAGQAYSTTPIPGNLDRFIVEDVERAELLDAEPRQLRPGGGPFLKPIGRVPPGGPVRRRIPGRNDLTAGDVFAVRTRSGNYARVKVIEYGYNLTLQWVTMRPGSAEPLYGVIERALDCLVPPTPFVFPLAVHGYIFGGISFGGGQVSRLIRQTLGTHSYYQEQAPSYRFHFLPDAFKLTRVPDVPPSSPPKQVPLMQVHIEAPADNDELPEHRQVTMTYLAVPFVDPARLQVDAAQLRKFINGPLPDGIAGPVLQPLLVDSAAVRFRPGGPAGGAASASDARIDLLTGIHASITLPMPTFSTLFDAMFGAEAALFDGQVEVDLGEGSDVTTEVIQFTPRMTDLVGSPVTMTYLADASGGGVATLQNTIESPVVINALTASFTRGSDSLPANIQGVTLPARIPAAEHLNLPIAPAAPLQGDGWQVSLALTEVTVEPDAAAILDAILDKTTAELFRTIHVSTVASLFDPPADAAQQVIALVVDLKRGDGRPVSVELSPSRLTADPAVPAPMRDFFLHRVDEGEYQYRVTTIRQAQASPGEFKPQTSDHLWILQADLTGP
jgi:hypothetical protein